jgi:hypothetical protein
MTKPDLTPARRRQLERLAAEVDRATTARDRARLELARAVRNAVDSGVAVRTVADAIGRSHVHVLRIVREAA